ncbi:hypothetical protein [Paenibacillus sp. DCT19]|uniref:hypothetical protein n=1 Tax=Paenibacillus sp. DCT19 TaxID=2211212 RepID=UPI000FE18ED8|nr:hypothetical protein [Paenibacillus sp. DCT19]
MNKSGVYTVQEWSDYIEGRIPPSQSLFMEQALMENPDEMHNYVEALDVHGELPSLNDPTGFADSIMHQINQMQPSNVRPLSRSHRYRWVEHKVFHYAVAACLTLIFLSSGVFDKVAPYHLQDGEHGGSFTEKWTEAATSWLDNFKPKP